MATKTIGTSGRDYSTLAAWASYANALSLSAPEIANCYNDGGAEIVEGGSAVTVGGWTGADATNTVTLQAASGQGFWDNASVQSNALYYNGANGVAFKNSGNYSDAFIFSGAYLRVIGLQFRHTIGNDNNAMRISAATSTIDKCIFQSVGNSSGISVFTFEAAASISNCLIVSTNSGKAVNFNVVAGTMIGCTLVSTAGAATTAMGANYCSPIVKNCVGYGFTGNFDSSQFELDASCTNNATDVGFLRSNVAQNGQTGVVSGDFEAAGSDYRLASGSTNLKDQGATTGNAWDIANTARPQGSAYDIGCWEYVASVSGNPRHGDMNFMGF